MWNKFKKVTMLKFFIDSYLDFLKNNVLCNYSIHRPTDIIDSFAFTLRASAHVFTFALIMQLKTPNHDFCIAYTCMYIYVTIGMSG